METTMNAVLCPSCNREMGYQDETKSFRCLACNPEAMNIPKCKTVACKRPLTRLGDPWNCWICLHCNDHPEVVNKRKNETEKPERNYIDTTLTKDAVKDMIQKELAGVPDMIREAMSEFSLKDEPDPDYPPTRAEINQLPEVQAAQARPVRMPWIKRAKELGVKTHYPDGGGMRKKAEILLDIERKEHQDETNQQSADQGTAIEDGQDIGGEPERAG